MHTPDISGVALSTLDTLPKHSLQALKLRDLNGTQTSYPSRGPAVRRKRYYRCAQ
jgi:hypothetical protein